MAERQLKIRQVHGALSNVAWGEKAKVRLTRVEEHVAYPKGEKERQRERSMR